MPLQFQVIVSEFAVYQPNIRGEIPRIAETFWLRNLDPVVEGWAKASPVGDWPWKRVHGLRLRHAHR